MGTGITARAALHAQTDRGVHEKKYRPIYRYLQIQDPEQTVSRNCVTCSRLVHTDKAQTDRQADRQADRKTDTQTHRHTHTLVLQL